MGSRKPPHDQTPKRGRIKALSTFALPTTNFPKFLVLHSQYENPVSKLSPFLVHKVLVMVLGDNFKMTKMPSGDRIEIENKA